MKMQVITFGGMNPRTSPLLVGNPMSGAAPMPSVLARNVNLASGKMVPMYGNLDVETLPDASRLSIYKYNGNWLSWPYDVDVAKTPVADDQFRRIYYTGTGTPKVRGIISGDEREYDLGVPAPILAPKVAAANVTSLTWTRDWQWYYEEPDGVAKDGGHLTEGAGAGNVNVQIAGLSYKITSIPARVTASSDARFVVFFDAYSAGGTLMGRVYPATSMNAGNSNLFVSGAQVSLNQALIGTYCQIVLAYDISTAEDWTQDRAYVYTYVTAFGEEGPPSPPSDVVSVLPINEVVITGMSIGPLNAPNNVTLKRLYRTVTGASGNTDYQLVAEIPVGQSSYTDSTLDVDIGSVIDATNNYPPPADLVGLVSHPAGFFAGFTASAPNTIWISKANQPHAWPAAYAMTIDDDIVALGVVGHSIVVATTGIPRIMTGDDPSALTIDQINVQAPCLSKRGLVSANGTVFYPSNEGLISIDAGGSAQVATASLYTTKEWHALSPSSMIGAYHDMRYIGFTDQTTIILGLAPGIGLTETDQTARGVRTNLTTDGLYIINGNTIQLWQGNTTENLVATWRSGIAQFAKPAKFSVGRVICAPTEAAPLITMRIYANQQLVQTIVTPTNGQAFRLPVMRPERFWQIEVETSVEVYELLMSTGMSEL